MRATPGPSTATTVGVVGEGGFSLPELLVVLGLIAVLAGGAVMALPGFTRPIKADSEMQRVEATLRRARDLAVTQRRNILVTFPTETRLTLARQDVSGGTVTGTTELESATMESGFRFRVFPELPDTPDAFGHGSAREFDGAASIRFTSEGALVDQTGDPVNGTIFIGQDGQTATARAITVLGVTGLVTGYRWNGREWTR